MDGASAGRQRPGAVWPAAQCGQQHRVSVRMLKVDTVDVMKEAPDLHDCLGAEGLPGRLRS